MMLHGDKRGFSLVEALIALLILSTGLLALGRFQGSVAQASAQAKARTEALRLAEEQIEIVRGFTTLAAAGTTTAASGQSDTVSGSNALFTRTWYRTNLANNTQEIRVTVSWQDRSGSQSVELKTWMSQVNPAEAGNILYLLENI
ncbi:MAG: prepilin-type N-terminal cleavage/methylation domain-containing protein [Magnetococcus sp. XQGC-1]